MTEKQSIFKRVALLLGGVKRKDKDLYDAWMDMVAGLGMNTSERIMQLLAWDIETGGVNIKRAGAVKKELELGQKEQEINHMKELSDIAKQAILDNVKIQQDFSMQLNDMLQNYNTQFINLQKTMQELQNQLNLIQEQRKLIEQEAVKLDLKEKQLEEKEKQLSKEKKEE